MKNTMKKILGVLLSALLIVFSISIGANDVNAYVQVPTECTCDNHLVDGYCTCCIMCDNLDTTFVLDCCNKLMNSNGETYWVLCCALCTGLKGCGCGCACCESEHQHDSDYYISVVPDCTIHICGTCGEINPNSGHKDENNDNKCEKCNKYINTAIENDYEYAISNNEAVIIGVSDSISGDVVIPSTLGGYPVVAIGDEAFYGCIYITSVTIPEGVTSIGKMSFAFCLRLKNIVLPESLKLIDNGAFVLCFLLEKIVIPENVDMINDAAFAECKSLKEIIIYNSDISFGDYVLETQLMPKDISTEEWIELYIAGYEAYSNGDEKAEELEEELTLHTEIAEEVAIPGLTIYSYDPSTAKTYAEENGIPFKNISELEEDDPIENDEDYYTYTVTDGKATIIDVDDSISGDVAIPSTLGGYPVVAIGDDALVAPFITSVTIPEGVTSIGNSAFAMCVKLKSITLPETLTEIDDAAFANCISLEEIILPEGVEILNNQVFYGCFSLERLVIKNSEIDMNKDEAPCYVNYKLKDITLTEFIEKTCEAYELYLAGDEEGCTELMGELNDKYVAFLETPEPLPLLTIYSHAPSTAKTYAEENGIPFKNISELEEPHSCTYGEWFTETEPTVFSEGVSKRVCECGEFETKPIAKLQSAVTKDDTTKVEITYTEENFESEVEVIVSEESINANIVFGDYENIKAYDISLTVDGESVQPNGYVTVKLPLPEGFNAETTEVYYVAPDGTKTKLDSTVENGYVVFETNHFSEYVLVDESSKIEPPHEHSYTASITKTATCTEPGTKTYTCSCGDTYTETIEATGHSFDGSACKNCDFDKASDCSCNCHKGGIMGFFWKIINFFNKLFKSKQLCACGAKHW